MPNRIETAAHRRLRAAIDEAEPLVARAAIKAFEQLQASVSVDRLERALASRDAFAIHDLVRSLPVRLGPAVDVLKRAFDQGGTAAATMTPRAGVVAFRFDSKNPFAAAAAKSDAGRFVVQITSETRAAIKAIVARSFTDGIPPREAAQLIRPLIGLTTRQMGAVMARRANLIDGGASATHATKAAQVYAKRLLGKRAEAIARTEIIRASSAGQIASWEQARAYGLLGQQASKVWIVTDDDRLCFICRPMNGRVVLLHAQFKTKRGQVAGPPAHPLCRCALGFDAGIRRVKRAA